MRFLKLTKCCSLVVALVGLSVPALTTADVIAVIGTGQVAKALGPEFAKLGHKIVYGSRSPERADVAELVALTGTDAAATTPAEAVSGASIIVLAVPGEAAQTVVKSLGDLSGKIIIDPTNVIRKGEDGLSEPGVDSSNAELIQEAVPGAHVVKAFNTLNWRTMVDPDSSGGPVSIPIVGNNDEAKAVVARLVEGMGLEAIDLGPLRYAHYVEGMLILWINRYFGGQSFDYHLRKTAQPAIAANSVVAKLASGFHDALAAVERPSEDKLRDAARQPKNVLDFLGIGGGMTVLDVAAGAGWYTEVLSAAVGDDGHVISQNSFTYGPSNATTVAAKAERLGNVTMLFAAYGNFRLDAEVDAALTGLNLHDFQNRSDEEAQVFLSGVYKALKPGGVFGVIDHEGSAGLDNASLHRIELTTAVTAIENAGFIIEAESDVLDNPTDDHTLRYDNESLGRNTDRFLIRARKPD